MKKLYFFLSLLLTSITGYSQILLTERFDYPAHATNGLHAQSAGVWTLLNTGDSILIETGSLNYPGLAASVGNRVKFDAAGSDAYTGFTAQTSGSVYASFLLNVTALTGTQSTTNGGYFAGFIQAGSTTNYGATVWLRAAGTNQYQIGINTRTTASATSWLPTLYNLGTTNLVVISYDINAATATDDVARIWVNPTALGGAAPAADATAVPGTDLGTSGVGRFLLRQNDALGTPFVEFDELRVGLDYASVTPTGTTVSPTLTLTGIPVPDFGSVTVGSTSASATVNVSGANLTGAPGTITVTASSTDFQVSNDNTNFSGSTTIAFSSATLAATPVYVRFSPQSAGNKTGTVNLSGGGAVSSFTVSGTGAAIPVPAAPVATPATGVTSNGFTANWNGATGATGYRLDVYTQATGTITGGPVAVWTMPASNTSPNFTNRFADAGTTINIGNDSLVAMLAPEAPVYSTPAGVSSTPGSVGYSSVSTPNWQNGQDAKYWVINVNTTGVTNLTLSSAQGGSNTGPKNFKVQYSIGSSGTWTDVAGGTVSIPAAASAGNPATFGVLTNLALPAAVENLPLVYIRWIMTDNVSVNGSTVASGGTSRISGIEVKGNYTGNVITYVPGYQNLSVGNVTSHNVTGLSPNTTYYYVVRAENAGGTSASSNEISVLTSGGTPTLTAGTLAPFGNVCVSDTSNGAISVLLTGQNLTAGAITVGPLAGYQFGTGANNYQPTLTFNQPGGSLSRPIYVQFKPTTVGAFNGSFPISGGGASAISVAVSGQGVNTTPTVVTGSASGVTTTAATLAGSFTSRGCSNVTAYGIVYSTTNGFAPATGTSVPGTGFTGNSWTVNLSGLTPNTTYYYVAYATNAGGTAYGTQQQFTTSLNPGISASALGSFGDVCANTVSAPRSFTISGSNLTNADVVVGPFAGYTFSTTTGGTYTAILNIPQTGGTFSQEVFVKFAPTAVQPYNGNIPVNGGGIASVVNVPVTGNGVRIAPSVTTGAASNITSTSATMSGTITAAGCATVTAYGFKVSTVNGFDPTSASPSVITMGATNLSGNNFSVNMTGLTPNTTYYYVAFASNDPNATGYGQQQSFTTANPTLSATALTAFGNSCVNTTTNANSFTITGTNLVAGDITVGPLAGYSFSTTANGAYTASLTIPQTGGAFTQEVFVKFTPTSAAAFIGNIPVSGGSATAINVAASGTGINTAATVTAGTATAVTTTTATIPGTITSTGCSAVTAYGVIYSTASGFNPAVSGTNVAGAGLAGGNFTTALTGLAAGTPYYYVTYATNAGGTTYSAQGTFTTTSNATIPVAPVATAATAITGTGFTANWNAVTGATGYFLDVYTMGTGTGGSVVAGWNTDVNTAAAATADSGNVNNNGIQQLTTNTGGTISYPSGYSGTSGTPNPYSVSSNGWNGGAGTKYWQVDVNTTGATNLTVSSNQGGSNTGPKDFKIQYRVGAAGTWTDVPGGTIVIPAAAVVPGTPATWGVVTDLPLPAAVDNQPLVSLRWLMTSETSINNSTVASGGTSRISGIYVKSATGGGGPVPVYVTGYQNLNVGNVTTYAVTGLQPNTQYYYVVRATNAAGTSPNSNEIPVTTAVAPSLTATALAAFGNLCPGSTSSAASFTINGANLTNANITVGPLSGFAFSTTSGGTYTPTLTLTQAGGTFSQPVFVQFTPTAVQSYNGNIPVSGAGATAINVAASGAGANNAPTVTTGSASAITHLAATLGGTISNPGCTAVTAYGIEWSTTSGFANGTGTQAASTNLAGSSFTATLSGLTPSTVYYYKAYATNANGTGWGAQQSFTTAAGPVILLTATPLATFDSVCVGAVSAPRSFTINGSNLSTDPVTVGPLAGFSFSTTAGGVYTPSLSLAQPGGTYSQNVFVQFAPTAVQSYNGSIPVVGGGSPATFSLFTNATGKVEGPTVVTLDSSAIGIDRVTVAGRIDTFGCSAVTEYGIEYSGIPNFPGGTGTRVVASNLSGRTFSADLTGLVPGATYYYRAYARNAGSLGFGAVKSVTLPALLSGLRVFPTPATGGQELRVTLNNVSAGYHGIRVFNSIGDEVYRKDLNVQSNYINERIALPASLASGVYFIRVVSNTEVNATTRIFVR
ncbi:T9SS type A sorting domain-containing protein [Flaviaesturariibacter amylovorans]|uniref:Fibronectin type-III domain-containing protein n=1 Tax=Flaviaesturariibacter amylovorans TaxID=1084520 RepID=A0ABP8GJE1_9BACT